MKKEMMMTTEELLEWLKDTISIRDAVKNMRRERAAYYEKMAREEKDPDIAELYEIEAEYNGDLEDASRSVLEKLVALKERIERRED